MSLDISLSITVDTGSPEPHHVTLYDANITHNLTPMWAKAGVYDALYGRRDWDDETITTTASDLIPILERGLAIMDHDPAGFKALNPANGWGDYEGAVRFIARLLAACREHPKGIVDRSR